MELRYCRDYTHILVKVIVTRIMGSVPTNNWPNKSSIDRSRISIYHNRRPHCRDGDSHVSNYLGWPYGSNYSGLRLNSGGDRITVDDVGLSHGYVIEIVWLSDGG